MILELSSQLKNVLKAPSPEQAILVAHDVLLRHGLLGIVYSVDHLAEPLFAGAINVKRWIQHFMHNNYFAVDPLYKAAQESAISQYWRAYQDKPEYSDLERSIYREVGAFGIAQGFDVSVADGQGRASLCFYFSDTDHKLEDSVVRHHVELTTIYLHERVCQLTRGQVSQGPAASTSLRSLTTREKECLQWVGRGLTYEETARALGITERTVTFHLQNAKKKLRASTLAHAMARATDLKALD